MYYYHIYGINIESEIALHNIPQTKIDDIVDVSVLYGDISYENVPENSRNFYYSRDYVCFSTVFCSYSIRDGRMIIVHPEENANPHDVASYIIGWCMAYLFTQRGFTCLHSTALDIDGQGVIISGVSGSGKSTTALSLLNRGYKYLTDDITIVNPLISMDIVPAYPLQKVCHNIADYLDQDKLLYINESRDKYAYVNTDQFCDEARPWTTLILLKVADIEHTEIQRITGLNMLLKALECMYLAEIYSFKGTPEEDKFRLLKGCEKIRVYEITRPQDADTTEEIADIICRLVHEQ